MTSSSSRDVDDWLALKPPEPILDPDLLIIDPHHHLWDRGGHKYLAAELLADLNAGHRIVATGYVECLSGYRPDGPAELRPVGETAFVVETLPKPLSSSIGLISAAAAIIGYADMELGAAVEPVLAAHIAAAPGRFRGVRYATAWHESDKLHGAYPTQAHMLDIPAVREGIATLGRMSLTFDVWAYFTQLHEVAAAADACPGTIFVLDHLGGVIGIGPFKDQRAEVFAAWSSALNDLAQRPNVKVKLGGLGMALAGFGFRKRPVPPGSQELATAWAPYIETAITAFGPDRAMFESNYPVDRVSGSHRTIWNAFKHIAASASSTEKAALFHRTAAKTYGIAI